MRVLTVIGNRPQFIKAAAVSHRLRDVGTEVLVHTGQHYDAELSQVFFDELGLPRPEHQLDLGGGSNTSQTARMLAALEPLLAAEAPDAVLVYGDTNSTLAGALAGAQAGVPVAHVEAGMRSYDRTMPEELNRVLDRPRRRPAAVLLGGARRPSCAASGVAGEVEVVGDVMVDVALLLGPRAARRTEVLDRARGRAGRVPARHRAPGGQRRRPGAPRAPRRAAGGDAGARRAPAPPAHGGAAGGGRPAAAARGARRS